MIKRGWFFIFLLVSFSCSAQLIVNVESSRIQSDTIGWMGGLGTSFSYTKNVQEVLNVNATAHVQYKTNKDLYLALANYNLLKGNDQDLFNNMFYHLRYNHKFGKVLCWEVFTQLQQNSINNIDLRALFGTGPRFKMNESKTFKIYAATLAMYEYEVDKDPRIVHKDFRGDSYVSLTYKPNPVFDLTSTTFYQPLFKQLNDYRILNQVVFNIRASKHFIISTNWDYSYDAFPAFGAPNVTFTITNGLSYTF